MKKRLTTALVWVVLIALFMLLYASLGGRGRAERVDFQRFLADIEADRVHSVAVRDNELTVELAGTGATYTTLGVADDELIRQLSEHGVLLSWGAPSSPLRTLLIVLVAVVLLIALLAFLAKRSGAGTQGILTMRKSRARLLGEPAKATFQDVGGAEEAKDRLRSVIDYLKNPTRFESAGVRLPRGVLLEGPPGCGKTLLARAVAGEAGVPFFLVAASEFVEMFVGVGAARVRDMFEVAAKSAPCVVFIDELDAVGRRRGSGIGAGHDEREQTLNQLLVCLDGFETTSRIVVLAATNRSDVLDKALLRPGRFDLRIAVPPLGQQERVETLRIHTRNKLLGDGVSLDAVAEGTEGWNGAELENLANEAALSALARSSGAVGVNGSETPPAIQAADFDRAIERRMAREHAFDRVDALLIESTAQLAQPAGRTAVRLTLRDGTRVEGEVIWADGAFVKVKSSDGTGAGAGTVIVPKLQVVTIEALDGTDPIDRDEVVEDRWARHVPDLA